MWAPLNLNRAPALSSLRPARLWLGLKDSGDQGTAFDLRVEAVINDEVVAPGEKRCITGVTRNPDKAKEVTVPFGSIDDGTFAAGDKPSLIISASIGINADGSRCPGHSNAVGLRLYYDGTQHSTLFGVTLAPEPPTTSTSTSKDTPGLIFKNGNPWRSIGTRSLPLP